MRRASGCRGVDDEVSLEAVVQASACHEPLKMTTASFSHKHRRMEGRGRRRGGSRKGRGRRLAISCTGSDPVSSFVLLLLFHEAGSVRLGGGRGSDRRYAVARGNELSFVVMMRVEARRERGRQGRGGRRRWPDHVLFRQKQAAPIGGCGLRSNSRVCGRQHHNLLVEARPESGRSTAVDDKGRCLRLLVLFYRGLLRGLLRLLLLLLFLRLSLGLLLAHDVEEHCPGQVPLPLLDFQLARLQLRFELLKLLALVGPRLLAQGCGDRVVLDERRGRAGLGSALAAATAMAAMLVLMAVFALPSSFG